MIKLFAVFVFLQAATLPSSNEVHRVTLDLVPTAASAEDKTDRERYLSNPVNSQCNLVTTSSATLVKLAEKLEYPAASVSNSVVSVRFPIGEPMNFVGTVYEGIDHHGRDGPFLWEGEFEGDEKYFASLVIEKSGRVKAYLSTISGMFRLLPARDSGRYFLCQRDASFSAGSSTKP